MAINAGFTPNEENTRNMLESQKYAKIKPMAYTTVKAKFIEHPEEYEGGVLQAGFIKFDAHNKEQWLASKEHYVAGDYDKAWDSRHKLTHTVFENYNGYLPSEDGEYVRVMFAPSDKDFDQEMNGGLKLVSITKLEDEEDSWSTSLKPQAKEAPVVNTEDAFAGEEIKTSAEVEA